MDRCVPKKEKWTKKPAKRGVRPRNPKSVPTAGGFYEKTLVNFDAKGLMMPKTGIAGIFSELPANDKEIKCQ